MKDLKKERKRLYKKGKEIVKSLRETAVFLILWIFYANGIGIKNYFQII